jgi:hypothetical protein
VPTPPKTPRKPARDAVAESRSNPYSLPRGEPLRRELGRLFRLQRASVLAFLRSGRKGWAAAGVLDRKDDHGAHPGGPLPPAWPDWHDFGLGAIDQAWRFTPLIRLTWEEAASAFAPKVGLDPDEWSVVNPHTEAAIRDAVLAFSGSMNATTTDALDVALRKTREELHAGIVTRGEALEEITARIQSIFSGAEKYRARRIAWTETSRAVHAAQEAAAIASGVVTGWKWLLSSDACPACVAIAARAPAVRLGHAFAVIGDDPHYSQIKYPPAHPHCNCSLLEVLDTDPQPAWRDTLRDPAPATEEEHEAVGAALQERDGRTLGPRPPPRPAPAPRPAPPPAEFFELPARDPMGPTPGEPIGDHLPTDEEIAAAFAAAAKPKPKPPPKPKPKAPGPTPLPAIGDDFDVVRTLGGSTGAKLVEHKKSGRLYVLKKGGNADHLREEAAADALYRAAGLDVPRSKVYDRPGGPVKLAEFHRGVALGELRKSDPAAYAKAKEEVRKGFVADALLGNWDAIGMGEDNILVTPDGKVLRIDNGGSLRFRAQGARKAAHQFGDAVTELDSMRNPGINPAAAEVFGGLSDAEIRDQIKALARKKAAILKAAPADLRPVLERRIEWLKSCGKPPKAARVGNWKPTPADRFRTFATPAEADAWTKSINYEKWARALTPSARRAIQDYKDTSYIEVNAYHRDPGSRPETPQVRRITAELDRALAAHPTPEAMTTVRYFHLSSLGLTYNDVKLGMELPDAAYVSTSVNPDHVWSGHRIEVRVPAGTPAGYVRAATPTHQGEYELLLGRGAGEYRVVELKRDAGRTIVVELVRPSVPKGGP